MQMNSVDWEKDMTQEDFLEVLYETQQIYSSPRQLTELRSKGWLPELQRRSSPGSKKPLYVWDEPAVEQALYLHDLLQVSRADHWVRLALWLKGYQVDFAPIRQRWLNSIDAYLKAFTQGESDDPLDNINDVVEDLKRKKWGYTPTRYRPEPFRRLGPERYVQVTEVFWDVLLVPELNKVMFAQVLAVLQMLNPAGGDTQLPEEFAEGLFPWLRLLQEVLAMPRLREVIEQATPDQWEQARLDYETLCQICQALFAPVTRMYPKGVTLLQFVGAGFYLVPVALAIQYRGYGQWIEDAFERAGELFADPGTQALIAKFARTGEHPREPEPPLRAE